jgi:hypothetical protein
MERRIETAVTVYRLSIRGSRFPVAFENYVIEPNRLSASVPRLSRFLRHLENPVTTTIASEK